MAKNPDPGTMDVLITSWIGEGGDRSREGTVENLPAAEAKALIRAGRAVLATDVDRKAKTAEKAPAGT